MPSEPIATPRIDPSARDLPSVAAAAETLRRLMIEPDATRLEALVDDALSYGHSGGKVDTKASFIGDLMSGASDFRTIEIAGQSLVQTGDLALIRHRLSATTCDGGRPGAVLLHVLQVWRCAEGGWRLVARQAVKAVAT